MAIAPNIPSWPADLPCPQIADHSAEIYTAVVRTPFEGGNTRQRRIHNQIPHAIKLTWIFKQKLELGMALNWINVNGFNWFSINLPGALASIKNKDTTPTTVRFISDLQTKLIHTTNGYVWFMEGTVEWEPADSDFGSTGSMFFTGDWIIAGDPATPSAPDVTYVSDWVIAGDPPFPNSNKLVIAGDPITPAALV